MIQVRDMPRTSFSRRSLPKASDSRSRPFHHQAPLRIQNSARCFGFGRAEVACEREGSSLASKPRIKPGYQGARQKSHLFLPVSVSQSSSTETSGRVKRKDISHPRPKCRYKRRYKTELCEEYMTGEGCRYGKKCVYAHGRKELIHSKLFEYCRAGLGDARTYRTRPCWSWISTGACPFGVRCHSIHDPRFEGAEKPWLSLYEMPPSDVPTSVHIDNLHHKMLATIFSGNPFGDPKISLPLWQAECEGSDTSSPRNRTRELYEQQCWLDFYARVCNIDMKTTVETRNACDFPFTFLDEEVRNDFPASASREICSKLTEQHRLEIALLMRGSATEFFMFDPKHKVYGELCMVLQTRAFSITSPELDDLQNRRCVSEISLEEFHRRKALQRNTAEEPRKSSEETLVHEIAFSSDGDSNAAEKVALWFDIEARSITPCTNEEARKIGTQLQARRGNQEDSSFTSISRFSCHRPFYQTRPLDTDAFHLVTAVMRHRLQVISATQKEPGNNKSTALLQTEEYALLSSFLAQRCHWSLFSWPVSSTRSTANEATERPPPNGTYEFPARARSSSSASTYTYSACLPELLWNSMMSQLCLESSESKSHVHVDKKVYFDEPSVHRHRLPVFVSLCERQLSHKSCSTMKHGTHFITSPAQKRYLRQLMGDYFKADKNELASSQKCWLSLLLSPDSLGARYKTTADSQLSKRDWAFVLQNIGKQDVGQ